MRAASGEYVNLPHLEWLIGEPVPDPEMVVYEVRPYAPVQADRIIDRLCALAGLDVAQARNDPERAERVRQAFGHIVDGACAREALLDLEEIEREIGRPPWRDLLKEVRRDRRRFAAAISDRSVRIALRWALRDLGLAARAGPRCLHYVRDNRAMLRRVIDRALEARLLQRDAGRSDRYDRVVLVQGVGRAYQLLTGRPLARSVTSETKNRAAGAPAGPGLRLVRTCLESLDPAVTDDAIAGAIRAAEARPFPVTD
jgi:hypothetical protein